jgi:hypothetical protein
VRQRHIERYGPDAAQDFTDTPVTAQWRVQHVLVAAMVRLDGPMIDPNDVATRQEVEDRHAELMLAYDLRHLDLHEITTSRWRVTQTIAASCSTEAPPRSDSRRGWTATRASRCSRGAGAQQRSTRVSLSPIHRPNSSST